MLFTAKQHPPGYYVYVYIRKDGTPFYFGKGKGGRAWSTDHGVKVPNTGRIIIIDWGLTEFGAFAMERKFIRWFGRKDVKTGILRNRTEGADGASGAIFNRGRHAWNNGVEERKAKECPGPGWVRGSIWTEARLTASRSVLKEINDNRVWMTNGSVDICVDKNESQPHGFWVGRASHSRTMSEKSWWNNGIDSVMESSRPGPEWTEGRLMTVDNLHNKGRKWWNNGVDNKLISGVPNDPSWKQGRLKYGGKLIC